jgi:hypothetical protein
MMSTQHAAAPSFWKLNAVLVGIAVLLLAALGAAVGSLFSGGEVPTVAQDKPPPETAPPPPPGKRPIVPVAAPAPVIKEKKNSTEKKTPAAQQPVQLVKAAPAEAAPAKDKQPAAAEPVPAKAAVVPEPAPITKEEQEQIDKAIRRGVKFLKATQLANGSWSAGSFQVGFAALPGLTLLECGARPNDLCVQRVAQIIRLSEPTLDNTYELSLAILFLDRLGQSRDKRLIQTFAARLIAGQRESGGWNYDCPLLTMPEQQMLLTFLRQHRPIPQDAPRLPQRPEDLQPIPVEPVPDSPGFLKKDPPRTGKEPDPTRKGKEPTDPTRTGKEPTDPTRTGKDPMDPSRTGKDPRDPSRTGKDPADPSRTGKSPDVPSRTGKSVTDPARTGTPRDGERSGQTDTNEPKKIAPEKSAVPDKAKPRPSEPRDDKGASKPGDPELTIGVKPGPEDIKAAKLKSAPKVVVEVAKKAKAAQPAAAEKAEKNVPLILPRNLPPRLRDLVVVTGKMGDDVGSAQVFLRKGKKGKLKIVSGRTDNSNTQFAMLALWVARRHNVPVERTMAIAHHRFYHSQQQDGSWAYLNWGDQRKPQMTCVGLMGVAMGHGAAQELRAGLKPGEPLPEDAPRPVIADPVLETGLRALARYVGQPGEDPGKFEGGLYYLWSLERVAMLCNLKTIGGKDWYRWAAGLIMTRQTKQGGWQVEGYPGAGPTIDTCFALLVLRRTNFVRDLTSGLQQYIIIADPVRPPKAGPP